MHLTLKRQVHKYQYYRPFLEAALAVHDPGFPAVIEGGVLCNSRGVACLDRRVGSTLTNRHLPPRHTRW